MTNYSAVVISGIKTEITVQSDYQIFKYDNVHAKCGLTITSTYDIGDSFTSLKLENQSKTGIGITARNSVGYIYPEFRLEGYYPIWDNQQEQTIIQKELILTANRVYANKANINVYGDINVNANVITGLKLPTLNEDATNKKYVDDMITEVTTTINEVIDSRIETIEDNILDLQVGEPLKRIEYELETQIVDTTTGNNRFYGFPIKRFFNFMELEDDDLTQEPYEAEEILISSYDKVAQHYCLEIVKYITSGSCDHIIEYRVWNGGSNFLVSGTYALVHYFFIPLDNLNSYGRLYIVKPTGNIKQVYIYLVVPDDVTALDGTYSTYNLTNGCSSSVLTYLYNATAVSHIQYLPKTKQLAVLFTSSTKSYLLYIDSSHIYKDPDISVEAEAFVVVELYGTSSHRPTQIFLTPLGVLARHNDNYFYRYNGKTKVLMQSGSSTTQIVNYPHNSDIYTTYTTDDFLTGVSNYVKYNASWKSSNIGISTIPATSNTCFIPMENGTFVIGVRTNDNYVFTYFLTDDGLLTPFSSQEPSSFTLSEPAGSFIFTKNTTVCCLNHNTSNSDWLIALRFPLS